MKITPDMLRPIIEHFERINWNAEMNNVFELLKKYAKRAGRVAAKPMLQFYYVMIDENTTMRDKALIYGSIIYVILPGDLLPRSVFKFLGIVDDIGAFMLAYNRVKNKITPAINSKVEETLDEWFGSTCEVV